MSEKEKKENRSQKQNIEEIISRITALEIQVARMDEKLNDGISEDLREIKEVVNSLSAQLNNYIKTSSSEITRLKEQIILPREFIWVIITTIVTAILSLIISLVFRV